MMELSEAQALVRHLLVEAAVVLWPDGDEGEFESPVVFATTENIVDCTATVYERFNGAVILRIDARVGEVLDSPDVREWVLSAPGHLPFVQIRYERRRGTSWSTVVATHSVAVDGLTTENLEQIVSSFDYIVPKWATKVGEFSHEPDPVPRESARGATSCCNGLGPCDEFEEFCNSSGVDRTEGDSGSDPGAEGLPASGVDSVLREIDSLIGLAPVKALVADLANLQRVAMLRGMAGFRALQPSPHLVFTGNPGTGKTTVARLVGRLYREMGLLRSGHVVETGRHGLVGGYVGQTAIKTMEMLESAKDGVLFIDEAYSLAVDHKFDYGREAIETIVAYMENNRGRIAVVVAGYPEPMEGFLRANHGLASRFDCTIGFPDYSDIELLEIFESFAAEHNYTVTKAAREEILSCVGSWKRDRSFPNGRGVRKLFNETVVRHSRAVVEAGSSFGDFLTVIGPEHIPDPVTPARGVIGAGYL